MQASGDCQREKAYVVLVRGRGAANRKLVNDPACRGIVNSLLIGVIGEKFDETQFSHSVDDQDDNQQLDNLNRETLKEQLLLKDLDMRGESSNSNNGGVANVVANVADYEATIEDANLYRKDLAACAEMLRILVVEMPMLDGFTIVLKP
jgi:hypothetical protein